MRGSLIIEIQLVVIITNRNNIVAHHYRKKFPIIAFKPVSYTHLGQACWFMNAESSAVFLVQYVWEVTEGKGPTKNGTQMCIRDRIYKAS